MKYRDLLIKASLANKLTCPIGSSIWGYFSNFHEIVAETDKLVLEVDVWRQHFDYEPSPTLFKHERKRVDLLVQDLITHRNVHHNPRLYLGFLEELARHLYTLEAYGLFSTEKCQAYDFFFKRACQHLGLLADPTGEQSEEEQEEFDLAHKRSAAFNELLHVLLKNNLTIKINVPLVTSSSLKHARFSPVPGKALSLRALPGEKVQNLCLISEDQVANAGASPL